MPVGIEKIVVIHEGEEKSWKSFWITPNHALQLKVKYHSETPEATKGHAKWIVKPKIDNLYSSKDQEGLIGDNRTISIKPKYCGPKQYIIEAFIDEPLNKPPTQLTFRGKATQKIVSTKWSKTNGGSDIRNSPIKYGDPVWLNIETEGLNGATLDIDVFNPQWGDDEKAASYKGVKCNSGEVNLFINNTYTWRAHTGANTANSGEKFYIKVSLSGKKTRILDDHKDDEHARYLKILDKITTREVGEFKSAKPLMVGENEVNVERYELCRFTKIDITDDKDPPITIFEEGKIILDEKKKSEFQVSETIHFDLDKSKIRSDAKPVLDGIANLLLDNPYISSTIGAHCDIRADNEYNDALSQRRAIAAVNYLVSKGVDKKKISARGYGKRKLLIEGEGLSEEEHQLNRRLTVEFKIFGDNAESMVFETIAPDETKKKKIEISIETYKTDKCLRKGTQLEHDNKNVKVIELTSKGKNGPFKYDGTSKVKHEVYSNLSKSETAPLRYIWPHKNKTNNFLFYINSCRYYSNKNKATVIIKAYPDIKWDFHFFLNLSNPESVTWNKLKADKLGEMRKAAGKIGSEKRYKQTDIDFGVILEGQWNKINKDTYEEKWDATLKYESKIKKFYNLFSSLKDISKGITSQTKGKVTGTRLGKKLPFSISVTPPNFALGAEWQLSRAKKNNKPIKEIGTEIDFYLKSKPIIGLKMVIDLLDLIVQGVVAAASGGTANIAAKQIFDSVREWLADDDHAINVKMYIDLVFFGTIDGEAKLKYHTVSKTNEGDLTLTSTIGVELKAGIEVKAGVVMVGVEFYANGQMIASGKGSITFGHKLTYKSSALNYRPELKFDGIVVSFVIKAEVGLAIKKGWFSGFDAKTTLADYEYKDKIVDEFDVIEKLEKFTGVKPEIPLIKNN